jgi:hypothetical protein
MKTGIDLGGTKTELIALGPVNTNSDRSAAAPNETGVEKMRLRRLTPAGDKRYLFHKKPYGIIHFIS